jgi:1-phosphofructokinase family hexose kinase
MAKYILTVTLNPALDRTLAVESLRCGVDLPSGVDFVIAGGKGVNVARVLTRLGHKAMATGMLGGNTGRTIASFLQRENISASFSPIAATTRVHTTIREVLSGRITRLLERGLPVTTKEFKQFKIHYQNLLKNASYVIFSGSLPPGLKSNSYCELIDMAHNRGISCALDTSGMPLFCGLRSAPEIIKPNYEELIALLGEKPGFKVDKTIFSRLQKYHLRYALLTLGDKGAWVSDFHDTLRIIHASIKGKNHVGCGDTFLAGFVGAMLRGKDIESCSRLAAACAAANLYAPYTGAISAGNVRRFKEHAIINRICPRQNG